MKIEFCSAKKFLDINNLSQLKIISIEDYGKNYQDKIDFPPGAHQIEVVLAREDGFNSISDFLIHVMSMQYANRVSFNLPSDFYDRSYSLSQMSPYQFKLYVDSYFEGFFGNLYTISPNLNLWQVEMNFDDYKEGYKIEMSGTEQVLMCRTSIYYMYFISQSID